jgi:phthiocerol/phenolphthiocerol synthesis type-I polyketide synthase E
LSATDEIRSWLVGVVSKIAGTRPEDIDPSAPFDHYGINSVEAVTISGQLEDFLGAPLSPTMLYDHPTINRLASALGDSASAPEPAVMRGAAPLSQTVCLVGMACRFPGAADTTAQFWQNLLGSVDAATEVPADRWNAADHFSPDIQQSGTSYTKVGGFIADVAGFDSEFFGLSPREALRMDPQQRLLLEVAWEALENSGIALDGLRDSRTAVFAAMMSSNQYGSLQTEGEGRAVLDDPYFGMGTAPSVAAGRLSYLLDLHGPSMSVDTACSSSLVAVHLAAGSLRAGEADLAIVGGVSAILHPDAMRQACKMGMLAPDGKSKTFDSEADGFLMGEGCGVVVLERWSDAVANGHQVLALLRGSAVNQDGASNGLTAPSGAAQVAVIRDALAAADLAPERIDYVEAHGSGTLLGDSIEMSSLHDVFGPGRDAARPLVVGAVKTNIGHLTGASGVAGLIKTVLAMRHGQIPPNLHLATPSPLIDWARCPTLLPDTVVGWPERNGSRLAGVSSFGWSGTNAHCVLEQAPAADRPEPTPGPTPEAQAILLSARTPTALSAVAGRLADRLRDEPSPELAGIAFASQAGRAAMECRATVTCNSSTEALKALKLISEHAGTRRLRRGRSTEVTFLLPGSGEQYEGMGAELYESEEIFRGAIDECAELVAEPLGCDFRELIYPADHGRAAARGPDLRAMLGRGAGPDVAHSSPLFRRLDVAHTAVFAMDYACAQLWAHWGVRPSSMLGYSLGEYVAACLANVLSLDDALNLVLARAQLVQRAPGGAMLAVGGSAEQVRPRMGGDLSVAAVNGPQMCVVAGTEAAVSSLAGQLRDEDIACQRVPSSHPMHSSLLDPLRGELADLVASFPLGVPEIPFVSNLTGTWITPAQATDPRYWAAHMCQTVLFASGVVESAARAPGVLLEVGPGQLASLAKQVLSARRDLDVPVLSTLRSSADHTTDRRFWLHAAAGLWSSGVSVDWRRAHPGALPQAATLPSYPFEHRRYWPVGPSRPVGPAKPDPADKPAELADWCYAPAWRQTVEILPAVRPADHNWLLFADELGLLDRMGELLRARGATVTTVRPGPAFAAGTDAYVIDPANPRDYVTLAEALTADQRFPDRIVHGLTVDAAPVSPLMTRLSRTQELGLCSILSTVQALAPHGRDRAIDLLAVSSGAHEILGGDGVSPDKAMILGACRTIPQEFRTIRCRAVDVPSPQPGTVFPDHAVLALLAEACAESADGVVAHRGGRRWVRDFRPVRLEPPAAGPAWRDNGVYLITGGTGELGLMIAAYLRRATGARLALLSRSTLPSREDWPRIIGTRPEGDALRVRLESLGALERSGADLLYLTADVSDPVAVTSAIAEVQAKFGQLNGIIHAAGVPGGGLIQLKSRDDVEAVLRPKVAGTAVLYDAVAELGLDFLMLFSSAVVAIGGLGESDYCAANCFLDALAASVAGRAGPPVVAIDWGPWQRDAWQSSALTGLPELRATMRSLRDRFGITDDEGTELMSRIIASGLSQVVVLPQDVDSFAERWSAFATLDALVEDTTPETRYPRPELAGPYAPPRTDAERTVAGIWAEHLGLEKVGIDDAFFELGGNSLVGLTITARLEREFGSKIPAAALYEAPTVRTLSALITGGDAPPGQLESDTGRAVRRREFAAKSAARRGARRARKT